MHTTLALAARKTTSGPAPGIEDCGQDSTPTAARPNRLPEAASKAPSAQEQLTLRKMEGLGTSYAVLALQLKLC